MLNLYFYKMYEMTGLVRIEYEYGYTFFFLLASFPDHLLAYLYLFVSIGVLCTILTSEDHAYS